MTLPAESPPAILTAIERMQRRAEFLAAARGAACARGAVVVQALDRSVERAAIRAGFTATRKVGGAGVRKRAKRRLREGARLTLPLHGRAGFDYVFVARGGTAGRPWARLLDDVKSALISLAAHQVPAAGAPLSDHR